MIESLQESEFIFNQINSPINLLKICNNIGMVSWNKGELDEAVNYFEKAYNLAESLGNKNYLGVIRSNIGLVLWTKGDLDPALRSFERSKKIFEDLGIKVHLGSSLINIAIIYCNKGELEKSLQYNNDALALYTELNDKDNISKIYNNLGEIHQIKDDFDTAFEYFSKSLAIISEIGNPVIIGEVCLNIVQVASFKKDYELASSYSRRIYEMTQKDDSKLLNQTYRFSKALVLKLEGRLTSYAESQKMLNDIINEEKIKYELTIQAMLNLCEILINEIKFFGKEEIIAELEVLVSKLLDIARSQNLMQILVESLILQSKLSLFELDTKKAQDLLKQAQITAEERGLENLAILASVEYDLLLDKIEAFDFSKDSKISFAERFGLKELEDLIQRMITKNVNILPKQLSEEPILLLVVTDAGIPVYSKKFSLDAQYDDMLISGFLTAINSFIREAFSSEGSIERIKQKDFTLLFQTMDQLTFCYVIKGASYSALKKMDKFMLALKSSDMIWDEVMDSTQTGKSLEDLESINQLTEECFG
ncbi:MAG: tetratricopeptide repeat protein [Candidatus Thorarchaeota archaeon]